MKLEIITRKSETAPRPTPLLFVHGAWHGAWCWDEFFLPYFARFGYECHALSLRGHGNSEGKVRWASYGGYVEDVAQVAAGLRSAPVVIGHSMGGFIVQKFLETHTVPAGVLLASIPPFGAIPAALRTLRRHPVPLLKSLLTLDLYPLVGTPALARESFFSPTISDEALKRYFANIQSESLRIIHDSALLHRVRSNRIKEPMLVLGAADDQVFTTREVEATARAYRTNAIIFPNMAHDMMLERGWQAVADHILGWLGERGL